MKKIILTFFLGCLISSSYAQYDETKYLKDVESIEAIMDAYYDVVSGSSDEPWEYARDKFLHDPNALIVRINSKGEVISHSLESEYIPMLSSPREDFYEIELNREVLVYGNTAHVWSTYELRRDPNVATKYRGISNIILYYKDNRWWIASWIGQSETEEKIPKKYLGNE